VLWWPMGRTGGYVAARLLTIDLRARVVYCDRMTPHMARTRGTEAPRRANQQTDGRPRHNFVGQPQRLRERSYPQQRQNDDDRDPGQPPAWVSRVGHPIEESSLRMESGNGTAGENLIAIPERSLGAVGPLGTAE
jgi:hypothetical protein